MMITVSEQESSSSTCVLADSGSVLDSRDSIEPISEVFDKPVSTLCVSSSFLTFSSSVTDGSTSVSSTLISSATMSISSTEGMVSTDFESIIVKVSSSETGEASSTGDVSSTGDTSSTGDVC